MYSLPAKKSFPKHKAVNVLHMLREDQLACLQAEVETQVGMWVGCHLIPISLEGFYVFCRAEHLSCILSSGTQGKLLLTLQKKRRRFWEACSNSTLSVATSLSPFNVP